MAAPVVPRSALLTWCLVALTAGLYAQPWYAVQRVVDGDTVVLQDIGSVRLIGVDTPETQDPRKPVQHFGVESAAFLRTLLDGERVRLDYDHQRTDKYQRTLAYLYLEDGTFVNREIIRQGFGHAYLTYPFRYMEDFRAAEFEARAAERGLWGSPVPEQAQTAVASQVWVNSSSRVYHCPGTRYYGKTARGSFMSEADAQREGHRPAYGRPCSGATTTAPASAAAPPQVQTLKGGNTSPPAAAGVRVWVNTSSKVYHCAGTRYYGNTARGEYLSESDAESRGNRPAGGRRCGPASTPTASGSTPSAQGLVSAPTASQPTAASSARVWVNTSSGVYHCPGTRYYGTTKNGTYMNEADAQAHGHRPAGGRRCG